MAVPTCLESDDSSDSRQARTSKVRSPGWTGPPDGWKRGGDRTGVNVSLRSGAVKAGKKKRAPGRLGGASGARSSGGWWRPRSALSEVLRQPDSPGRVYLTDGGPWQAPGGPGEGAEAQSLPRCPEGPQKPSQAFRFERPCLVADVRAPLTRMHARATPAHARYACVCARDACARARIRLTLKDIESGPCFLRTRILFPTPSGGGPPAQRGGPVPA